MHLVATTVENLSVEEAMDIFITRETAIIIWIAIIILYTLC